jgi:HTH-type transcriptional regulator / antitoxin HipB
MLDINKELADKFEDREYREAYADDYLNTFIATQIKVLREQRKLSQEQLGKLIGTQQPGISRLENVNHSDWHTETLKKLAHALDVRLRISFETYGDLLNESTRFRRNTLERPEFDKDPVIFPNAAMDYYFLESVSQSGAEQTESVDETGSPTQVEAQNNSKVEVLAGTAA